MLSEAWDVLSKPKPPGWESLWEQTLVQVKLLDELRPANVMRPFFTTTNNTKGYEFDVSDS